MRRGGPQRGFGSFWHHHVFARISKLGVALPLEPEFSSCAFCFWQSSSTLSALVPRINRRKHPRPSLIAATSRSHRREHTLFPPTRSSRTRLLIPRLVVVDSNRTSEEAANPQGKDNASFASLLSMFWIIGASLEADATEPQVQGRIVDAPELRDVMVLAVTSARRRVRGTAAPAGCPGRGRLMNSWLFRCRAISSARSRGGSRRCAFYWRGAAL